MPAAAVCLGRTAAADMPARTTRPGTTIKVHQTRGGTQLQATSFPPAPRPRWLSNRRRVIIVVIIVIVATAGTAVRTDIKTSANYTADNP